MACAGLQASRGVGACRGRFARRFRFPVAAYELGCAATRAVACAGDKHSVNGTHVRIQPRERLVDELRLRHEVTRRVTVIDTLLSAMTDRIPLRRRPAATI